MEVNDLSDYFSTPPLETHLSVVEEKWSSVEKHIYFSEQTPLGEAQKYLWSHLQAACSQAGAASLVRCADGDPDRRVINSKHDKKTSASVRQ